MVLTLTRIIATRLISPQYHVTLLLITRTITTIRIIVRMSIVIVSFIIMVVGQGKWWGCGRRSSGKCSGMVSSVVAQFQPEHPQQQPQHGRQASDEDVASLSQSHRSRSDSVTYCAGGCDGMGGSLSSQRMSAEVLSNMATAWRLPVHSRMANFVAVKELPSVAQL